MLQQAHFLMVLRDYPEALKAYTSYLNTNAQDFEALIARSTAFYETGKYEESIDDAEAAMIIDRKRFEGYYRRGLAHQARGKYQSSIIDLEEAASRTTGDVQQNIGLSIEKSKAEQGSKKFTDIPERKTFDPKTVTPITVPTAQIQQTKPEEQRSSVLNSTGKIAYKWYQTDNKVGIEINQTLEDPSLLKTFFDKRRVHITFPLKDQSRFDLELELFGEITPEKCKGVVGLNQIEITLDKSIKCQNWLKLEADHTQPQASVPVQVQQQASYPTSAKVKKDWNKIDKEIEIDIDKNKEQYGIDGLNNLFQQIYQFGDEKTKMAMIKSMQTSGGTCLSTNWDEVKTKDYEGKDRISPPKGQERKKL